MTLRLNDPAHHIWGKDIPYWFLVLARTTSLALMLFGVAFWADLLGVFGTSGLERGEWFYAALRVVIACSFLIACLGVWLLSFWGVVMWVLSSLTVIAAIGFLPDFVSTPFYILLINVLGLIGLSAVSGWLYFKADSHE